MSRFGLGWDLTVAEAVDVVVEVLVVIAGVETWELVREVVHVSIILCA
jgi:hypothetical protein